MKRKHTGLRVSAPTSNSDHQNQLQVELKYMYQKIRDAVQIRSMNQYLTTLSITPHVRLMQYSSLSHHEIFPSGHVPV